MQIIYAPAPLPDAPGVFVDIVPPPPVSPAVTAPLVGMVFESSRGEIDVAYDLTSLADFEYFFGAGATDPAGAALSGHVAARQFFEAGGALLRGVRVASSLLSTGYLIVKDGAGNTICALHATTPGTWAQSLSFVFTSDTLNNVWGLTVTDTSNPNTPADILSGLPETGNAALIAAIAAQNPQLIRATLPMVQAPAKPTFSGSGSAGVGLAGWYAGVVTYSNAAGQTIGSPESATFQITGTQSIAVTIPTMTGATTGNIYLTPLAGSSGAVLLGTETLAASGVTLGSQSLISAVPAVSTLKPPTTNTATLAATTSTNIPATGTLAIPATAGTTGAPGADGANCGAARHAGGTTGGPNGGPSGASALYGYDQDPEIFFLAGTPGTDTGEWPTLGAFASSNAAQAIVGFTPGTTAAQVRTAVLALTGTIAPAATSGLALKASWPAAVMNDPAQGTLTTPSQAYFAAKTAATPRQSAAYNKPLGPLSTTTASGWSFVGTDIKATRTDIGLLDDPGLGVYVNVLTARIPSHGTGWFTDSMLAPKAAGVQQDSFEVRVRGYLAQRLYQAGGAYYGQPIDDALMAQAQTDITALLGQMADAGLIPHNDPGATNAASSTPVQTGKTTKTTTAAAAPQSVLVSTAGLPGSGSFVAYQVTCDRTVNLPATIAAGQFIIVVNVAIAPNARQVVLVLNAGVSVTISNAA